MPEIGKFGCYSCVDAFTAPCSPGIIGLQRIAVKGEGEEGNIIFPPPLLDVTALIIDPVKLQLRSFSIF